MLNINYRYNLSAFSTDACCEQRISICKQSEVSECNVLVRGARCMGTYLRTYLLNACVHSYKHTRIHTYILASVHTYMHAYINIHTYIYVRPYVHTCVYAVHEVRRSYGATAWGRTYSSLSLTFVDRAAGALAKWSDRRTAAVHYRALSTHSWFVRQSSLGYNANGDI
jgi:hypothetical protein